MIQIPARSLHRRTVQLLDQELRLATLMPFFDRAGNVDSVMLVSPNSSRILLVEPRRIRVRLWRRIQIEANEFELPDTTAAGAWKLVRDAWHYDPWWLLAKPRFAGHPAVPALKSSNLGDEVKPSVASFHPDLSQASETLILAAAAAPEPRRPPGNVGARRLVWRRLDRWHLPV